MTKKRTIVEIFNEAKQIEPRLNQHNVLPAEFVGWVLHYADGLEEVARSNWKEDDSADNIYYLEDHVTLPFSHIALLRKLAIECIVEHGIFPVTGKEGEEIPAGDREMVTSYLIDHAGRGQETLLFLGVCERQQDLPAHLSWVTRTLFALRQRQFILEPVLLDKWETAVIVRVQAQYAEDAEPQPAPVIALRGFLQGGLAGHARVLHDAEYPNIVWIVWPWSYNREKEAA